MSFHLHKAAPSYFKHLLSGSDSSRRFDTQFDAFYYCLLIGLDKRKLCSLDEVGEEFVRDYVQAFQPHAPTIAGLLVDAELDRANIGRDDVKAVEKRMVELLEAVSSSMLSAEGLRLLNQYGAGGFVLLRDALATPPQNLEEFLIAYHQLWLQDELQSIDSSEATEASS